MGVRSGVKTDICPPWKLGLRASYFWKNLKPASSFRLIDLIPAMTIFCRYETHTAQSQVHSLCHAVMSLQFTHVPSFACRGVLRKSRVGCSTVGLYRVTIPWQQTCKSSRYITVAGVLLPETVERTHLGR